MLVLTVLHHYFLWHYSRAWLEMIHVWKNFVWYTIHFFSLPHLITSWFAPWKRMVEGRGDVWNLEDLAGYVIVGLLSRIVGGLVRTVMIAIGTTALCFTVIAGALTVALWVVAPVLIVVMLISGIALIAVS
jgi:hypothetical protein